MISIVFPAYNEEENVTELHRRIVSALSSLGEPYEIVAVDNGSIDRTRERLMELSPITVVSLAYNIGQSAGLDAGIHAATGEIIVIIDADLQNDPADIPRLVAKIRDGYDAVVGWRETRHDSVLRRWFSRFANFVTRKIAGVNLHDFGCAMRVFRREQITDFHLYGVMHVFIPVILSYRGARIAEFPVHHAPRKAGVSHYTFAHMASDIADLLAIKFLYGYAARPLVFFGSLALACLLLAVLIAAAAAFFKWYGLFGLSLGLSQTPLPIFASLFVILAFLLFMLGFVTELLIRIYYEGRGKTPYRILDIVRR